jgi:integrase
MGQVVELLQTLKVKHAPNPKGSRWEHRRPRKWLTPEEVDSIVAAIRKKKIGRYPERDALMIDLAYRHGLRASELLELRWSQFEINGRNPILHVMRKKRGTKASHPIEGDILRFIREHERRYRDSPYVFYNPRTGMPFTLQMFSKIVRRAGNRAKIPFPVHPHMLRHARGTKLAREKYPTREIQAFLGHGNIQNTQIYTEFAADAERFTGFTRR